MRSIRGEASKLGFVDDSERLGPGSHKVADPVSSVKMVSGAGELNRRGPLTLQYSFAKGITSLVSVAGIELYSLENTAAWVLAEAAILVERTERVLELEGVSRWKVSRAWSRRSGC